MTIKFSDVILKSKPKNRLNFFKRIFMKNNQGKQTELVKREIVNYIIDHKLNVGDRIPTQAVLRTELGVGNAVIGRAIQALTADGVLAARGRQGVFIASKNIEGYAGRNIAIICHHDTEFSSAASMVQALSIILNQRACHMNFFIKRDQELKDNFNISEFPGLERSVKKHEIDGIISLVKLDEKTVNFCTAEKIPLCYMGFDGIPQNVPSVHYHIDLKYIMQKLNDRKFKRPMLIHMGYPFTEELRNEFLKNSSFFDFGEYEPEQFCCFLREDANSSWSLEVNMKKIILLIHNLENLKPEDRPDVLIIPDDVLATWIAGELNSNSWSPELIHVEYKQCGFSWHLRAKGDFILFDLLKLAENCCDILLMQASGRKPEKYNIKLVSDLKKKILF